VTDVAPIAVSQSRNVGYLPAVDHLRGMAALLMIVYHGVQQISDRVFPRADHPLDALVVEGHTAVAMFIVVSGFILTYGALGSEVAYGRFLRNRLLRVGPMYLLIVVIGFTTYPSSFSVDGLLQFLTLTATPPFDTPDLGAWGALLWTVSVELTLYLVFPFLLRFLTRYGPLHLVGLLAMTNILRLLSAGLNPDNVRDRGYWTVVGRVDQFVLGMLVAWVVRRGAVRLRGVASIVAVVGAAVVAVGTIYVFNRNGGWTATAAWKAPWPLIEGLAWAVFIGAYVIAVGETRGGPRWLVLPGVVSYSAYLLHYTYVVLLADHTPSIVDGRHLNGVLVTLLLVVPATFLTAALTYAVVERPFMQLRGRYLAGERVERPAPAGVPPAAR